MPQAININLNDPDFLNPKFREPFFDKRRFVVCKGGRGSGKSYNAGALKLVTRATLRKNERFFAVRKIKDRLRVSTWQQIKDCIRDKGLEGVWKYNETLMIAKCIATGSTIGNIGLDDVDSMKSMTSPTSFWCEEATEFLESDIEQLNMNMRGKAPSYFQMVLTLNPINARHWIRTTYAESGRDLLLHHSTVYDNPRVDLQTIEQMENLKGHTRQWALMGEWGVLEGAVFEPMIMDGSPESFDYEAYGLDFGFNHPMALIWCGFKDGEVWPREIVYRSGLTTKALIEQMNALGIDKNTMIYADSANPEKIQEIKEAGYSIMPAKKHAGSVLAGIDLLKGLKIHGDPASKNLLQEWDGYAYIKDRKTGVVFDDALPNVNDDGIAALRYCVQMVLGPQQEVFNRASVAKATAVKKARTDQYFETRVAGHWSRDNTIMALKAAALGTGEIRIVDETLIQGPTKAQVDSLKIFGGSDEEHPLKRMFVTSEIKTQDAQNKFDSGWIGYEYSRMGLQAEMGCDVRCGRAAVDEMMADGSLTIDPSCRQLIGGLRSLSLDEIEQRPDFSWEGSARLVRALFDLAWWGRDYQAAESAAAKSEFAQRMADLKARERASGNDELTQWGEVELAGLKDF